MLKNAHIVIYPINKKGELNVVCIIRQKLSNNIDLKALIKKEGWSIVVIFFLFYLVRDSIIYILIPYIGISGLSSCF